MLRPPQHTAAGTDCCVRHSTHTSLFILQCGQIVASVAAHLGALQLGGEVGAHLGGGGAARLQGRQLRPAPRMPVAPRVLRLLSHDRTPASGLISPTNSTIAHCNLVHGVNAVHTSKRLGSRALHLSKKRCSLQQRSAP